MEAQSTFLLGQLGQIHCVAPAFSLNDPAPLSLHMYCPRFSCSADTNTVSVYLLYGDLTQLQIWIVQLLGSRVQQDVRGSWPGSGNSFLLTY